LALTDRSPRCSGALRTYTVLASKPGCVFMTDPERTL
jgi:hypothetical protein